MPKKRARTWESSEERSVCGVHAPHTLPQIGEKMANKLVAEHAYTDTEFLALAREAYAKVIHGGHEVEWNGRRWNRGNAAQLATEIERLEKRIAIDSGGIAMAQVELDR